jgi:hypothetical protein
VKVHRFERKLIPKNDRGKSNISAIYALRRRMVNARWWKASVNCYKTFHFFALFPLAASETRKSTLFVGLDSKE